MSPVDDLAKEKTQVVICGEQLLILLGQAGNAGLL